MSNLLPEEKKGTYNSEKWTEVETKFKGFYEASRQFLNEFDGYWDNRVSRLNDHYFEAWRNLGDAEDALKNMKRRIALIVCN